MKVHCSGLREKGETRRRNEQVLYLRQQSKFCWQGSSEVIAVKPAVHSCIVSHCGFLCLLAVKGESERKAIFTEKNRKPAGRILLELFQRSCFLRDGCVVLF